MLKAVEDTLYNTFQKLRYILKTFIWHAFLMSETNSLYLTPGIIKPHRPQKCMSYDKLEFFDKTVNFQFSVLSRCLQLSLKKRRSFITPIFF